MGFKLSRKKVIQYLYGIIIWDIKSHDFRILIPVPRNELRTDCAYFWITVIATKRFLLYTTHMRLFAGTCQWRIFLTSPPTYILRILYCYPICLHLIDFTCILFIYEIVTSAQLHHNWSVVCLSSCLSIITSVSASESTELLK